MARVPVERTNVARITFLGTGGGRFATIYQIRNTGGIFLEDGTRLHLDPGPGALANMRRLSIDPGKLDGLLVSHCHPDHYTEAEVLLEGMVRGGFKKRGTLVASESVLSGVQGIGPAISEYHQALPERVVTARPGSKVTVGGVLIEATRTVHGDPTGVGFKFHTSGGLISYVSDTQLTPEVVDDHRGARVLVVPLTRPLASGVPHHLSTEGACSMIGEIGPEMAVLTHFGMKLLHDGVQEQVDYIERGTGVRTVAATDLMSVRIGERISLR